MRGKWIVIAPFALLGIVALMAIGGEIVRLLWNWLLPPLFGWPPLTFWQALGMLALCRILFGGSGRWGSSRSKIGNRIGDRIADRITDRMTERWGQMTPEERDRMRQRLRERFGSDSPAGESK